ncbi:TorF family putative porin [Sphingoaurantiacus capsulatus]|uniref:TorF family putative porin n=1 Tax=Sphingoaurantiacus capsulatus TaxID=1771310 RepID=A0ABV7X6E1_9SPHN
MRTAPTLLTAALLLGIAAPAAAIDLSASVTGVTDYRYRGISLSDRDPALQASVEAELPSGIFLGAWGSTIEEFGGADTELDLYAGWGGENGLLDYNASVVAYIYPGGDNVNYGEVQGEVGRSLGPARLAVKVAYAPDQKNTAGDNIYVSPELTVGLPLTPLTFRLRGGWEDGFYDQKLDWEAGVDYALGPVTAFFSVVGTNYSGPAEAGNLGKTGVLVGASLGF